MLEKKEKLPVHQTKRILAKHSPKKKCKTKEEDDLQ
jgi:hypothetical protein